MDYFAERQNVSVNIHIFLSTPVHGKNLACFKARNMENSGEGGKEPDDAVTERI